MDGAMLILMLWNRFARLFFDLTHGAPKVSRSLRIFIQAYGPDKAVIVNTAIREHTTIGSTPLSFITGHELASHL
jgi:6-phosphogluconolactonase/glucosamine-6-phosphate isomerase/deaminase